MSWTKDRLEALDREDPLAPFAARFAGPRGLVDLAGHLAGPLPAATPAALARLAERLGEEVVDVGHVGDVRFAFGIVVAKLLHNSSLEKVLIDDAREMLRAELDVEHAAGFDDKRGPEMATAKAASFIDERFVGQLSPLEFSVERFADAFAAGRNTSRAGTDEQAEAC